MTALTREEEFKSSSEQEINRMSELITGDKERERRIQKWNDWDTLFVH